MKRVEFFYDYASTYSYLGPEATFTEAAVRSLPESATRLLLPSVSVPAALDAVRRGEAEAAMVCSSMLGCGVRCVVAKARPSQRAGFGAFSSAPSRSRP